MSKQYYNLEDQIKDAVYSAKQQGRTQQEIENIVTTLKVVDRIGRKIEDELNQIDGVGHQQGIFRALIQTIINSYLQEGIIRGADRNLVAGDLTFLLDMITQQHGMQTTVINTAHTVN